ncbi:MAG: DHH family phosphoesterase [Chloroflexota bacterium]
MNKLDESIKERLQAARNILIVTHVRPDGDAIGSLLGLGLALQADGKQVQMLLPDGLPSSFKHLPGSEQIQRVQKTTPDLSIVVDCSDLKRVGKALDKYGKPDIVVDHHVTNEAFGTFNLIESESPATASVLLAHMPNWGLTITPDVAANLLTGLITDTLGFRTLSTTAQSLRQAADMVDLGVNLTSLYNLGLIQRPLTAARYWGLGLSNLQYQDDIVWTELTLKDRSTSGYSGNDDADLINVVSSIEEGSVSIIFVEQTNGTVKISWRTQDPNLDVSQIATKFNGGGHKAAAGADIPGDLADVKKRVLEETANFLKKR